MRKLTVILIALVFLGTLGSLSFAATAASPAAEKAQANPDVIRGKIFSMDSGKNEIVVKTRAGAEKTIVVDPKMMSELKVGESVKVTLKAGTNVAEQVKKVEGKMKLKNKSAK
jgi:hypothetical protein